MSRNSEYYTKVYQSNDGSGTWVRELRYYNDCPDYPVDELIEKRFYSSKEEASIDY